MKLTHLVSVCTLGLAAVACGGSEPPAADPSTTNAQVPEAPQPAVETPAPVAATEPAKPAQLDALNKPASTWEATGKSLSEISAEDLANGLKKAGWIKGTDTKVTQAVTGQYESITIPVEKGKAKGTFKLIRPAKTPGAPDTASAGPVASKAADTLNKDMAASKYDDAADVSVSIELTEGGKMADAEKALNAFVKPAKK